MPNHIPVSPRRSCGPMFHLGCLSFANYFCSCRRLFAFALVFVTAACVVGCSHRKTPTLAITHVTVIDATGAPARADMTVLLNRERIAQIGPASSIEVPSGTRVVDGSGKFLIPGLVDMHVHLTGAGEP